MKRQEFVIRQLAKTNKKNYENYVVSRIYHRLNRSDVKFSTQQYVRTAKGHSLTDMYLPQLGLHIEVDEPHHKRRLISDIRRDADIIDATNHKICRIKVDNKLENLDDKVDEVVAKILARIQEMEKQGKWEPWDIEKEFNPIYHRDKGYLNAEENPAFRRIVDACNCLGQDYKAVQTGWFKSKVYHNHYLWFPKFYENDKWDNQISNDGKTIIERCKDQSVYQEWYEKNVANEFLRITFPRSIDNLGFKLYRFAGIFKTDRRLSSFKDGIIHNLIDTKFII